MAKWVLRLVLEISKWTILDLVFQRAFRIFENVSLLSSRLHQKEQIVSEVIMVTAHQICL